LNKRATMRAFALALLLCVAVAEFNSGFWTKVGKSSPSDIHSVVFHVASIPNALDTCDSMLMAISTPGAPKYGKHMSFNEVGSFFRNHQAEKKALAWLRRGGISPAEVRMTPHHEMIRVTTTIAKLEKLLGAKYFQYASVEKASHKVHRALDFNWPAKLKSFITSVSDTNILPVPPSIARRAFRVSKDRQSGNVSPSLLASFYRITVQGVPSASSTLSLFESLGQDFSPSDLSAFQTAYSLPQVAVANVIGSNQPSACSDDPNNCGEANLDVQWALAVTQNATLTYWSVPGNGDIFLQWVEAVTSTPNPPLIHSLSYGSLAPEDPKFDVESFNTAMCKLGLKGLTLFVATGDDGVANFGARGAPSQCGFTPSFPATSPYCVAVGATQGPEMGQPEVACTSFTNGLITTGGGFSTYVTRPTWQEKTVNDYLTGGPNVPPRSMFSSLGRAYPDIAMIGHNFPVWIAGQQYIESGTSASAPVVASMFTLINGVRLAGGKSPVGYITPTLYQLGESNNDMFHDITSGVNNCCAGNNGTQTCCQYGFTASQGWDPVCGFGSIDFKRALAYFSSL